MIEFASPTPRLIDPVHFFNHRGESVMTMDELRADNERLSRELTESQANVKLLAGRLKRIAEGRK